MLFCCSLFQQHCRIYLEPLALSVTEAAKALGVSRKTLSSIINGKAGISPRNGCKAFYRFQYLIDKLATSANSI